jgi:hypothetical protein
LVAVLRTLVRVIAPVGHLPPVHAAQVRLVARATETGMRTLGVVVREVEDRLLIETEMRIVALQALVPGEEAHSDETGMPTAAVQVQPADHLAAVAVAGVGHPLTETEMRTLGVVVREGAGRLSIETEMRIVAAAQVVAPVAAVHSDETGMLTAVVGQVQLTDLLVVVAVAGVGHPLTETGMRTLGVVVREGAGRLSIETEMRIVGAAQVVAPVAAVHSDETEMLTAVVGQVQLTDLLVVAPQVAPVALH